MGFLRDGRIVLNSRFVGKSEKVRPSTHIMDGFLVTRDLGTSVTDGQGIPPTDFTVNEMPQFAGA
jgi:hypothetical protein